MTQKLEGKVAIVTGGSRGMGRAYCERFAVEGATVAVIYHSNEDAARDVVGTIKDAGGQAAAFRCDVVNVGAIKHMVSDVAERFGGVDILINNAGIYLFTPVDETTEEVWDQQINTNLKSAFFCTQAVVPEMRKRGGGKIINISSIFGQSGFVGSAGYGATKAGVALLTKTLCLELRESNIQVNQISPGCIKTDLNASYRAESEAYNTALQNHFGPGDPWLDPEELAGAAVFLASADSNSITGANINIDRGYAAG
jgi:NAD(P)-dependent dehydrogenase (short-subunit alcohol dehydrogenase family)